MDGRGHASLITFGMVIVVMLSVLAARLPPDAGHDADPTKLLILAVQGATVGVMLFLARNRSSE